MKIFRSILFVFLIIKINPFYAQEARAPQLNSPQHLPPEAQFAWTGACFGDTTKFVNCTIRGGSYQWYIFDKLGDTLYRSTNTNISFYFPSADTFYVFLQADNGHIVSIEDTLIIGNSLKADFNYLHCTNQLLNHSFCATSYHWNFGDGATSTDSLPTHQYADTGTYVITLIASNGITSDTAVKSVYVSIIAYADGAFTLNLSNDTLFYQINNYIPYSNIYWGFGDGGVSSSQQGYYVYSASGTYNVYLNQTNGCGIIMHDTTLQVSVPAGIEETKKQDLLEVSPNPSSTGVFTIFNKAELTNIIVTNMLGEIVLEIPSSTDRIDLSDCSPGQYILRAFGSNRGYMQKLIRL